MAAGPLQQEGLIEIDRHLDAGRFAEAQRLLATYGERPGYAVATEYLATRLLYLKKRIGTKGVVDRLGNLLERCPDFPEAQRMYDAASSGELAGNSLLPPAPATPAPPPPSEEQPASSDWGTVDNVRGRRIASLTPPPVPDFEAAARGKAAEASPTSRRGEPVHAKTPETGPPSRKIVVSSPRPVANVNSRALLSPQFPKAPALPSIEEEPQSRRFQGKDAAGATFTPGRYSAKPPAEERLSSPATRVSDRPTSPSRIPTPPFVPGVPRDPGRVERQRETERKLLLDARTFVKAGEYDNAAPLLSRIEASTSASAELHSAAARLWLEMERPMRALAEAARALEFGPDSPQVRLTFASVVVTAARLYDTDEQIEAARRALHGFRDTAQSVLADGLRAYIQARYDDAERALLAAEQVLLRDRSSVDALSARVEAFARLRRRDDLSHALAEVQRVSPKDAAALGQRLGVQL